MCRLILRPIHERRVAAIAFTVVIVALSAGVIAAGERSYALMAEITELAAPSGRLRALPARVDDSLLRYQLSPTDAERARAGANLRAAVAELDLTLTLTARSGEQVGYLIELTQAGVFTLSGFSDDTLNSMLGAYCPSVLFPYAREVVSDLSVRGGFPQLVLAPVNFDALYLRRQQEQAEKETAAQH